MILRINTKDPKVAKVAVKNGSKVIRELTKKNEYGSQVLLPLVTKLLDRENLTFQDLKGIEVETGPGSFTGIRIGVSVANALAYSLNIPVNGKKIETELVY